MTKTFKETMADNQKYCKEVYAERIAAVINDLDIFLESITQHKLFDFAVRVELLVGKEDGGKHRIWPKLIFADWYEITYCDDHFDFDCFKVKVDMFNEVEKYLVEHHGFRREKDEFNRDIFVIG